MTDNLPDRVNTKLSNSRGANYRYRKFIAEYLSNGWNGTQAYLAAFKTESPEAAASCANRLLRNVNVLNLLVRELDRQNVLGVVKDKSFAAYEALNLLKTCKSEQVKARMTELINKIAGNTSDNNNIQVNMFTGIEAPAPIRTIDVSDVQADSSPS